MKKIYSFALAAVAILSAASCQKEELANDETLLGGGNFTVTASVAETKTVLEGLNTYWTPGDKISVFDESGKAVQFGTSITEKAASAQFTNEADFSAPESVTALYPAKADATLASDVIGILRIGGAQNAVAGSFDPTCAIAVGTEASEGNVAFDHINCLFKFTIGGKTVPSKVVLTNGGARQIAGQYKYNVATGEVIQLDENGELLPGAKAVTLKPSDGDSFKVGETYYIAAIPGGNFANITLSFDETVVKTLEGAKYADATNNKFLGKIINLGTVCFPGEDVEPEPAGEKVIWEGSHDTAEWSGNQALAWGGYDWTTANVGERLKLYVTPNDATADWWCVSLRVGGDGWANLNGVPTQYDKPAYSITVDLTQEILDDLIARNGLVLTGNATTITKVSLLPADAENVIWAGEAESDGYSTCEIGSHKDLPNNGAAAGDKFRIYVTAGDAWALQMYPGWWGDKWFATGEGGIQEGLYGHGWSNYNTDLSNGYIEFELTEEMVTAYADSSWGKLAILQGEGVKITKITLK